MTDSVQLKCPNCNHGLAVDFTFAGKPAATTQPTNHVLKNSETRFRAEYRNAAQFRDMLSSEDAYVLSRMKSAGLTPSKGGKR